MIYLIIIIFLLIFFWKKRNIYGYLEYHIYQQHISDKFKYNINKKLELIEGTVYDNNKLIGKLCCYNWKTNNNYNLYVGDDLFVEKKYRNKGIAKNLISMCSDAILRLNGFGVFSTDKALSIDNKLYELFWIKCETNHNDDSTIFKEISWNDVNFDNYPKHELLDANESYIKRFLHFQYLKGNKFIYVEKYNTIICVESLIDNDENSVSHVKWFWSSNTSIESIKGVSKYLGDDYVSIPKISVNITEKIWDKSYCYLYCKPKHIKIQKLDEKDILGWFLC